MILKKIKQKIRRWYYFKVKKISLYDYNAMNMRARGIKVGTGGGIFTDVNCAEPYLITIGNYVTLSTNIQFCTHDNAICKFTDKSDLVGEIKIGSGSFIGMNSIIMYGVEIGEDSYWGKFDCK